MKVFVTLVALSLATPAAAQEGVRDEDRLLQPAEMTELLMGAVLEFFDGSKSTYGSDGSYGYTYTDDGPVWGGVYRVAGPSEVCVDFDNGSARCDLLVDDGSRMVLIIADGTRFPVRNLSVDGN